MRTPSLLISVLSVGFVGDCVVGEAVAALSGKRLLYRSDKQIVDPISGHLNFGESGLRLQFLDFFDNKLAFTLVSGGKELDQPLDQFNNVAYQPAKVFSFV
jgi:hypothetical protein